MASPDDGGSGGLNASPSFELATSFKESSVRGIGSGIGGGGGANHRSTAATAAAAATPLASVPLSVLPSASSTRPSSRSALANLYAVPARRNGFQKPFHPSQMLVWFVVLTTLAIYLALVLPFVPRGSYAGRSAEFHVELMLYLALILVGLPCYIHVQRVDPGMKAEETQAYMEQGSAPGVMRRESSGLAGPASSLAGLGADHALAIGVARVCDTCDLWMGPRTKHCHLCRKCVDGFDQYAINNQHQQ